MISMEHVQYSMNVNFFRTYRVDLAKREEFKGAFKNDALDYITGHVMTL